MSGSLEVVRGEGGVTPLSGPEKILVRRNALGSLDARRFPRIMFSADIIDEDRRRLPADRDLTIHGKTRPQVVDVRTDDLGDGWRMSSETVGQTIRFRRQAVLATAGLVEGR